MSPRIIRANLATIQKMLAGRCAKCESQESDLCMSCNDMSERLTATKVTCEYMSLTVNPPTIYSMLVDNTPVNYYMVITALKFVLDAFKMACDPKLPTMGDVDLEYEAWAITAKKIAEPHIERENKIITDADARHKREPSRLTYLRMIEARLCFIQAVMKVAAEEATNPEGNVTERIDGDSVKMFVICGSLEVQAVSGPVSRHQAGMLENLSAENKRWNIGLRAYKKELAESTPSLPDAPPTEGL